MPLRSRFLFFLLLSTQLLSSRFTRLLYYILGLLHLHLVPLFLPPLSLYIIASFSLFAFDFLYNPHDRKTLTKTRNFYHDPPSSHRKSVLQILYIPPSMCAIQSFKETRRQFRPQSLGPSGMGEGGWFLISCDSSAFRSQGVSDSEG